MGINTSNIYRFETIVEDKEYGTAGKKWIREVEIFLTGEEEETDRYQVLSYSIDFQSHASTPSFNLVEQIGYVFDDVRLSIDKKTGKMVKVNNLPEIFKRWKETEKELLVLNRGAVVVNYCKQLESLLNREDAFIQFLTEYKMFGLYFNEMLQKDYLKTPSHSRIQNHHDFIEEVAMVENWEKPYREVNEKDSFIFKGEIHSEPPLDLKLGNFKYEGIFIKDKNRLTEGWVSLKNENKQIQYSVLWVG